MSYLSTGAVASQNRVAGLSQAVVDARDVVARYLSDLQRAPRVTGKTTKLLPSDDPFFQDDSLFRSLLKGPTIFPGSNIVAWPAADYHRAEAAWATLTSFCAANSFLTSAKLQFRKNDTNLDLGIKQTTDLLAAVDELLARGGVTQSRLGLYLGLAAIAGAALYLNKQKGGPKRRTKKGRRR